MTYTLQEIEEMLENTTEGEWWIDPLGYIRGNTKNNPSIFNDKNSVGNAEFIAASKQIIEQLLERVKELEEIQKLDTKALQERDSVLDEIPCEEHGRCVPGTIEKYKDLELKFQAARNIAISWREALDVTKLFDTSIDQEIEEEFQRLKEGK